ncbi:hypothetical protein ACQPYK_22430 [Streptosporangium sp. CA-135522]|uniref:hypothetical protein n=1 Tax=Streptosporangium sp. CA-135522 TaxID=3240072 RepID=UPI003D9153A3
MWGGTLEVPSDDTTGFSEHRPWWQHPAVAVILVAAGLAQVVGLVLRARKPADRSDERDRRVRS